MLDLPVSRSTFSFSDNNRLFYHILGKTGYEICRVYQLNNETESEFLDRVDALVEALNFPLKYVEKFAAK